jgi:Uma2 family endonuclease
VFETDTNLGRGRAGGDLVYRPEMFFIRTERAANIGQCVRIAPDLVVEIVSPESTNLDYETKREDYERAGVGEYWIIDPEERSMTFLQLTDGRYVEAPSGADFYESAVVAGFKLELKPIRALFEPN